MKRYKMGYVKEITESLDGEWVRFEDVESLDFHIAYNEVAVAKIECFVSEVDIGPVEATLINDKERPPADPDLDDYQDGSGERKGDR